MNLEQIISSHLNKNPKMKKVIKRSYQRMMSLFSSGAKCEGNVNKLSPDDLENEYFFGYYDKSPWDQSNRFVLCMRAGDARSKADCEDKADILVIDTSLPFSDSNRVKKIAETRTWNVQQGCMLQWLGPDYSSEIIFNDFRNGKYVSVILHVMSGKERIIDAPVYAVSKNGKTALSLDFSRLHNLRPGYGYCNIAETSYGVELPETTAVWSVDLENNKVTELLSYMQFYNLCFDKDVKDNIAVHKVNHIMINPSGKRFMILYRWFVHKEKHTRLITCNMDGSDMYLLADDEVISHCNWKNDDSVLIFAKKKEGFGYYLLKDKTKEYVHLWKALEVDGHPSYSPDGKHVVTDTYPNRSRISTIYIMNGENEGDNKVKALAKVFAPFEYDNDVRCDLHPRWNRDGTKVAIDSAHEGRRGLYEILVL